MQFKFVIGFLLAVDLEILAATVPVQNEICSTYETRPVQHNTCTISTSEMAKSRRGSVLLQKRMDGKHSKHTRFKIPNIVFFAGNWDPEEVVRASKAMVEPGTEFRYFSLSQMQASVAKISKHLESKTGTSGALDAFNALRPIAFRIDLWRAMVLWEYGGVYVDAKIKLAAPLSEWVDNSTELSLCHDIDLKYWNAMLAAPKRSPMLLAIIRKIIDNVEKRMYPDRGAHSDLFITSPGAYTDALTSYDGQPHCVCQLHHSLEIRKSDSGGKVVAEVDDKIHQAMRSCPTCNIYGDLFNIHQVYCDEEGPPCTTQKEEGGLLQTGNSEYWSKVVW